MHIVKQSSKVDNLEERVENLNNTCFKKQSSQIIPLDVYFIQYACN